MTWCCHFPKKPVLEGSGARPVAPRVSGVKKEQKKKKSVLMVPEQARVRWEGSGLRHPPWFNPRAPIGSPNQNWSGQIRSVLILNREPRISPDTTGSGPL